MPRNLLLTLKPLRPIPRTLLPKTLISRLARPDVHIPDMRRQRVARVERSPARLPPALVRVRRARGAARRVGVVLRGGDLREGLGAVATRAQGGIKGRLGGE